MDVVFPFDQPVEDPQVAGEFGMIGGYQQGSDVGRLGLAIPVAPPVALFNGDQRPRKVKVD